MSSKLQSMCHWQRFCQLSAVKPVILPAQRYPSGEFGHEMGWQAALDPLVQIVAKSEICWD